MTSPFDDQDGRFQVLVNDAGQHSLWPEDIDVPFGWAIALATRDRQACLNFIESAWIYSRRDASAS